VLTASVRFSESVFVSGSPRLSVLIGSSSVVAVYKSGTGTNTVTFVYSIIGSQTDTDGVSISANSLALNGGTINDLAGNSATITHVATAANTAYKVDTTSPNAPTLALGAGVANGASSVEARQASGVVTVSGETGSSIEVQFARADGGTATKVVTGTGAAVAVVLTAADVVSLGDGIISVTAVATDVAGNVGSAGSITFTLDTTSEAPTVVLGDGVLGGATSSEATQAAGVVTVSSADPAAGR